MERQTAGRVHRSERRGSDLSNAKQPSTVRTPVHPLTSLQRSIGNRALQRLLQSSYVQTKLKISKPGDRSEREADRVAESVSRSAAPGAYVPPASPGPPISRAGMTGQEREARESSKIQPSSGSPLLQHPQPDHEFEKSRSPLLQRQGTEPEKKVTAPGQPLQREAVTSPEQPRAPEHVGRGVEEPSAAESFASGVPLQRKDDEEQPVARKVEGQEEAVSRQPADTKKDDTAEAVAGRREKTEEPEAHVQRQETAEEGGEFARQAEEEEVQSQGVPDGGARGRAAETPSMAGAASRAIATKGPGEPINPATRGALESRLGADLSDVRVHSDSAAHEAADALNARAFTHQKDIWLGRGQSQSDTRLMAHEAAHVMQQAGSADRQLVLRAAKKQAVKPPASGTGKPHKGAASGSESNKDTGTIDPDPKHPTIIIPTIDLPKQAGKSDIPTPVEVRQDEREEHDQREKWRSDIKGKGVSDKVDQMLPDSKAIESLSGKKIFYLKLKGEKSFLIGERENLKERLKLPNWSNKTGKHSPLTVDHRHELQLKGPHRIENFQLLELKANLSAGSLIKAEIYRKIRAAVEPKEGKKIPKGMPKDPKEIRNKYQVIFTNISDKGPSLAGRPDDRYELHDVQIEGKHLENLEVLSAKQIDNVYKIREDPTRLKIFFSAAAGAPKEIDWEPGIPGKDIKRKNFGGIKGLNLTHVDYAPGTPGSPGKGKIFGNVFSDSEVLVEKDFKADLIEDAQYITRIDAASVKAQIRSLRANGFSPIEIFDADIEDRGVVARGVLRPDLPIFKDLHIDLTIDGQDVSLSKTFDTSDFNFPGPIRVTDASLTLSAGTAGFTVSGDVFYEIERVGKGKLSGRGSTRDGFSIVGSFDFDTSFFDPAKVHVEYTRAENRKGKFSGGGEIGIKPGKVRGIKSANVTVSFDDDRIDAKGLIKPDIPAVEQADLTMHYSKEEGMVIGGDLQLKKDIPGISDGSVHAEVSKKPGSERYIVKASGKATPKIPGVSSKLAVTYDDGAFDAVVTAGYEKGMLKGSVTVGATNRPVGDDGKPAGPPPAHSDKITLYGGGSVTLRLTPWLEGTAAIRFKPNGEVEVTGKIGLPKTVNIFDERKVEKNLFKIGIDIPIVGVAVLGKRIGIFLNISGGLDLSAGIGPGQLQDVNVSVTYNPAHEEDTKVRGHAALHIPAHAGLRLFVRGALGAGIPIVSAQAGIELGGRLGIEGAARAEVDIDWNPKKGLVLDAKAEISAEPTFKFDITGFVLVEADLLLKTITLYEKKWQLAAVEYGSGLKLGLKLPIHYEEGKPFNVSLSDIQFEVPKVDATEVLKGLIKKIA